MRKTLTRHVGRWHDSGWLGRVRENPLKNGHCIALPRISDTREADRPLHIHHCRNRTVGSRTISVTWTDGDIQTVKTFVTRY